MEAHPFRLERYELQALLARAERAEVWKAFDTLVRRYVAIKFLYASLQTDPEYPSRFRRETQALPYLRHPNIVQYFDFSLSPPVGVGNVIACIVMDYVDGSTLADYIRTTSRQGSFPSPADIAGLFRPICAAVAFAHQQGIIHGQLKPSNVLLDKGNASRTAAGEPVVTDFGMARLYSAGTSGTGSWFRSPLYTAPEQLNGAPADMRSDIYSLGIILYEIGTGTPPFPGNNPAIIMQHLNSTPPSPTLLNPTLPPTLAAVIMRCIAKDPSARFSDVPSLLAALGQTVEQIGPHGQQAQEATKASSPSPMASPSPPTGAPDMPTVMSAGWPGVVERMAPATPPPSGSSGASYPSPSTRAAMLAGAGGLAAAFPRAWSPGIAGLSQPFADLPSGDSPAPISPAYTPELSAQRPPAAPAGKPGRRSLRTALSALLILLVAGSSLGAYFAFFEESTPPNAPVSSVVGHAYFASSGLLSANPGSNQGITDQVRVELDDIPPPQSGMNYYAWLLNDTTREWSPLFLGRLTVNNGTAVVSYANPHHANLLATNSRFLVTEESAAAPPLSPSLNPSAWRYYAEFSQVPDPKSSKHYSLYDHIRHLLSADPNVAETGLSGGLDIWLYRNTQKVLEWAGSARDAQQSGNTAFIHRQLTRIMDYLDGTSYTQLAKDLPGQPVLADPAIAKVGLLTFDPARQPLPGYLYHSTRHLGEIALLPQSSPQQKELATQINREIDVVNIWFVTMRTQVLQLSHMTDAQLLGNAGRTLLDSVATLANTAFVGQINSQGQVTPGVAQIHYSIQRLATFDVRACTASSPCKLI